VDNKSLDISPEYEVFLTPLLEACMLRGHFELSSGMHSSAYFQTAPLLSSVPLRAKLASALLHTITQQVVLRGSQVVVAMAHGATLLGCELSRMLDSRILYMESCDGQMKLRRGQALQASSRVIMLENVVTTGGSLITASQELVQRFGCTITCIASLIDRRAGLASPWDEHDLISLVKARIPVFDPQKQCPLCTEGAPLISNSGTKDLSLA